MSWKGRGTNLDQSGLTVSFWCVGKSVFNAGIALREREAEDDNQNSEAAIDCSLS